MLTLAADGTQEWTRTSDVGLFADLPNLSYELVRVELGVLRTGPPMLARTDRSPVAESLAELGP